MVKIHAYSRYFFGDTTRPELPLLTLTYETYGPEYYSRLRGGSVREDPRRLSASCAAFLPVSWPKSGPDPSFGLLENDHDTRGHFAFRLGDILNPLCSTYGDSHDTVFLTVWDEYKGGRFLFLRFRRIFDKLEGNVARPYQLYDERRQPLLPDDALKKATAAFERKFE